MIMFKWFCSWLLFYSVLLIFFAFFAFARYQPEHIPKSLGLMLREAIFSKSLHWQPCAQCLHRQPCAQCNPGVPRHAGRPSLISEVLVFTSQKRRGAANSPTAENTDFSHSVTRSSDVLGSAVSTAWFYQLSCPVPSVLFNICIIKEYVHIRLLLKIVWI